MLDSKLEVNWWTPASASAKQEHARFEFDWRKCWHETQPECHLGV